MKPLTLFVGFILTSSSTVLAEIHLPQSRDRELRGAGGHGGGGAHGGGGGHGSGGGAVYYNNYYHKTCPYNNGNSTVCNAKKYKEEQKRKSSIITGVVVGSIGLFLICCCVYSAYLNSQGGEALEHANRVQACEYLHHTLSDSSCEELKVADNRYDNGWICDKCSMQHNYSDTIRRCNICGIDVCNTCEGDRPKPALVNIITYNYGRGYAATPTWLAANPQGGIPIATAGGQQTVAYAVVPGSQPEVKYGITPQQPSMGGFQQPTMQYGAPIQQPGVQMVAMPQQPSMGGFQQPTMQYGAPIQQPGVQMVAMPQQPAMGGFQQPTIQYGAPIQQPGVQYVAVPQQQQPPPPAQYTAVPQGAPAVGSQPATAQGGVVQTPPAQQQSQDGQAEAGCVIF